MLEELCKRIQHCCATLRRSRNKRNVESCWLKSLTGFKLCKTTSNNIQQHATGCANGRTMWHPTMLRPFARGLNELHSIVNELRRDFVRTVEEFERDTPPSPLVHVGVTRHLKKRSKTGYFTMGIMGIEGQWYHCRLARLRLRANRRNIVAQQLPTLLDVLVHVWPWYPLKIVP